MPTLERILVHEALPERELVPDTIQLFLYNAVLFNAHRIHYDRPYATEVEGYPDLVVPGPLLGDWLTQCVVEWLGDDGELLALEYSNRKASFVGETLRCGGRVIGVDRERREVTLEVYVRNAAGETLTPGTARARLHR